VEALSARRRARIKEHGARSSSSKTRCDRHWIPSFAGMTDRQVVAIPA
jgi:hypothetical protein